MQEGRADGSCGKLPGLVEAGGSVRIRLTKLQIEAQDEVVVERHADKELTGTDLLEPVP